MTRILVIDDDAQIREVLKQSLERVGYETLVAADGKAALKLNHATPVDLIITDIIMPEMEGLETIMEFRRCFPSVRVIAISGGGRIGPFEYLKLAEMLGAQKTIEKPFELRELVRSIQDLQAT